MIRAAIVIALASAAFARAQSTETLGRAEGPTQFQISAGSTAGLAYDGSKTSDLNAASVVIRHPIDGGLVGLRAAVWATDWRPRCNSNPYICDEVARSQLVAVMLMADWPIHLPYDFAIEPVAGAGVAPYTHASFPPIAYGAVQPEHRSTPPYVFSVGLALRWRWIVVEQHAFLLTNADDYFQNTLAPFTVGVRF